jgi:hypothetical protein
LSILTKNVYLRANSIDNIVKLDTRNYNAKELGDNLAYKINRAFETPGGPPRLVQYLEDVYNTVIIPYPTSTNTLRICTDEELKLKNINWTREWYDVYNLKSLNAVLGNYGTSQTYNNTVPYISNPISLQPFDYVLMNAYGLGNTSYGNRQGERRIIKNIPLSSYGETTVLSYFDVSTTPHAHKLALTRLKFTVTDPFGNIVDLHRVHIRFPLLFISND